MPISNPIPLTLDETGESRGMTASIDGFEAERVATIDAGELQKALNYFLPTITTIAGVDVWQGADRFPGHPKLQAYSMKLRPMGRPSVTGWYDVNYKPLIELRISYKKQPWQDPEEGEEEENQNPEPIPFSQQSLSFATEILQVPVKVPISEGDPSKGFREIKRTIRLPQITYNVTFAKMRKPPWAAIGNCIGKLHNGTIFGAPSGTVLFDGCETSNEVTSEGASAHQVRYVFIFNPKNWNKSLDPNTLEWVATRTLTGEEKDPYEFENMKTLFFGF